MEKIKILKIEEGKAPFVKEIANELKDCQAEVGGLIDCVCFEDGCLAVVNDEGKINGMKPNRRNGNDIICGPFLSAEATGRRFYFSDGRADRGLYQKIRRDRAVYGA